MFNCTVIDGNIFDDYDDKLNYMKKSTWLRVNTNFSDLNLTGNLRILLHTLETTTS